MKFVFCDLSNSKVDECFQAFKDAQSSKFFFHKFLSYVPMQIDINKATEFIGNWNPGTFTTTVGGTQIVVTVDSVAQVLGCSNDGPQPSAIRTLSRTQRCAIFSDRNGTMDNGWDLRLMRDPHLKALSQWFIGRFQPCGQQGQQSIRKSAFSIVWSIFNNWPVNIPLWVFKKLVSELQTLCNKRRGYVSLGHLLIALIQKFDTAPEPPASPQHPLKRLETGETNISNPPPLKKHKGRPPSTIKTNGEALDRVIFGTAPQLPVSPRHPLKRLITDETTISNPPALKNHRDGKPCTVELNEGELGTDIMYLKNMKTESNDELTFLRTKLDELLVKVAAIEKMMGNEGIENAELPARHEEFLIKEIGDFGNVNHRIIQEKPSLQSEINNDLSLAAVEASQCLIQEKSSLQNDAEDDPSVAVVDADQPLIQEQLSLQNEIEDDPSLEVLKANDALAERNRILEAENGKVKEQLQNLIIHAKKLFKWCTPPVNFELYYRANRELVCIKSVALGIFISKDNCLEAEELEVLVSSFIQNRDFTAMGCFAEMYRRGDFDIFEPVKAETYFGSVLGHATCFWMEAPFLIVKNNENAILHQAPPQSIMSRSGIHNASQIMQSTHDSHRETSTSLSETSAKAVSFFRSRKEEITSRINDLLVGAIQHKEMGGSSMDSPFCFLSAYKVWSNFEFYQKEFKAAFPESENEYDVFQPITSQTVQMQNEDEKQMVRELAPVLLQFHDPRFNYRNDGSGWPIVPLDTRNPRALACSYHKFVQDVQNMLPPTDDPNVKEALVFCRILADLQSIHWPPMMLDCNVPIGDEIYPLYSRVQFEGSMVMKTFENMCASGFLQGVPFCFFDPSQARRRAILLRKWCNLQSGSL